MNKNAIFMLTDTEHYKGYSNSLYAMAVNDKNNATIFVDVKNYESIDWIDRLFQFVKEGRQIILVNSVGISGESWIEKFESDVKFFLTSDKSFINKDRLKTIQNIKHILVGDRYHKVSLSENLEYTLIMPKEAINEYKNNYPNIKFIENPAELVASPSREEMEKRAKDYEKKNSKLDITINNILSKENSKVFFMGGRISLPDGSFKENTNEIFSKAGKELVNNYNDAIVVFHGLRSFTKGDNTTDLEPFYAFHKAVAKNMKIGQHVVIFGKRLIDNKPEHYVYSLVKSEYEYTKRMGLFKKSIKEEPVWVINLDAVNDDIPAGEYYYLLKKAIDYKKDLNATVEQMNFIPEALELGAKPSQLKPYEWELSVPSNIATYKKLNEEYEKTGKLLLTQKQVFENMLNNKNNTPKSIINLLDLNINTK